MNSDFNLREYRQNLLQQLNDRNKRESFSYQYIIKDYKDLYDKYKAVVEKNQHIDRELLSMRNFSSTLG